MAEPLVIALDCGTTTVKAALVDARGKLSAAVSVPAPCRFLRDGAVHNEPAALKRAVFKALKGATAGAGRRRAAISALSVTGQRATVFCLDGKGELIGPGINWQDMRGAGETARFEKRVGAAAFTALTGLPCAPVFTIGKLLHLRAREPARFRQTRRFALVNDFVFRLLGVPDPPADWSSASLTGLLDTGRFRWADGLLAEAGLRTDRLPALIAPGLPVGVLSRTAARALGLPAGLPLIAGAGDQQCAGLGAGVVRAGLAEITVGTVAAPLVFSERFRPDVKRRVMCCAHAAPGFWNLEGLQNSAGSSVGWLARIMGRTLDADGTVWRSAVRLAPGSAGVRFLPYLAGAAAPHWDRAATGGFLGLRLSHGPPELLRAVLEGVALESREILDVFAALGAAPREVRLTGGHMAQPLWTRLLADALGRPVRRLAELQATLLGAGVLAAAGVGLYGSVVEAADRMARARRAVRPDDRAAAAYDRLYGEQTRLASVLRGAGFFEQGFREGYSV